MKRADDQRQFTPYERNAEPLLPRARFLRRLAGHVLVACGILAIALAIGMVGYRLTEGCSWIDAFLNASMILGGESCSVELDIRGLFDFAPASSDFSVTSSRSIRCPEPTEKGIVQ